MADLKDELRREQLAAFGAASLEILSCVAPFGVAVVTIQVSGVCDRLFARCARLSATERAWWCRPSV